MAEKVGGAWLGRGDLDPGIPEEREADLDARGGRRRGRGLTGLLALAISGLVLYLAWCILWERSHPASAAARGVRKVRAGARLEAIRELERLGPQDPEVALPALVGVLADPEPVNRAAAAEALVTVIQGAGGDSSDPEQVHGAVVALMGRLEDPDSGVRTRATQALWMIALLWQGSPRVIDLDAIAESILRTADDRSAEVRLETVRGLGVIGQRLAADPPPRLVAALEDPADEVRTAAAQGLGQFFRRALVRMLPSLVRSAEAARPEVRPAYFRVLKQLNPYSSDGATPEETVTALASLLGSRDREVRCQVLSLISEFGPRARAAIPALVAVLGERNEAGSTGPGERGPSDQDPVAAAAAALAHVAGRWTPYGQQREAPPAPTVVAALSKLLKSPVAGRRLAAVNALGAFERDDVLGATLIALVRDRDASVRAAALRGLHFDAGRRRFLSLTTIREALEDDSPTHRDAAASALYNAENGIEPLVPALIQHADHDPDRSVRYTCASVLGRFGPPAITAAVVPMYIEALDRRGAPTYLQRSLIEVLTRFGPAARGAVPAITHALRSAKPEAGDEAAARKLVAENLRSILIESPPRPVEELEAESRARERIDLRQCAARALGQLAPGTPSADDAVSALIVALDDPSEEVEHQAVESLVAFGLAARRSTAALARALLQAREKKNLWRAGRLADALGKIDPAAPEAGEAIAFLVEALHSEDFGPRVFAERALGPFGAVAAPAIPRLVALSREPILRTHEEIASVAEALGQVAPGTAEEGQALAALMEVIEVEPTLRRVESAIDALARFGPRAAAASPRLHELEKSGDARIREAARKAVACVEVSGQ